MANNTAISLNTANVGTVSFKRGSANFGGRTNRALLTTAVSPVTLL
jgi:flagellar hook protein FlgE